MRDPGHLHQRIPETSQSCRAEPPNLNLSPRFLFIPILALKLCHLLHKPIAAIFDSLPRRSPDVRSSASYRQASRPVALDPKDARGRDSHQGPHAFARVLARDHGSDTSPPRLASPPQAFWNSSTAAWCRSVLLGSLTNSGSRRVMKKNEGYRLRYLALRTERFDVGKDTHLVTDEMRASVRRLMPASTICQPKRRRSCAPIEF